MHDYICHSALGCQIFVNLRLVCKFLARAAPGTPAYKSQEEYYDEIMELKKVRFAVHFV